MNYLKKYLFICTLFGQFAYGITVKEAMDYYASANYFDNNPALTQAVEEALNRLDLIGRENDWYEHNATNWYGDKTLEDFLLSYIGGLSLDNASTLEGIEKFKNLYYLHLERSSVTDFSPLHESSLRVLEYDESGLTSIDPSVFSIPQLHTLYLDENNFTKVPEIPEDTNLTHIILDTNLLDLGDEATMAAINALQSRERFTVDYDGQFPQGLINLSERIKEQPSSTSTKENFLHGLEILMSIWEEDNFKQLVIDSGEVKSTFSNFTLDDLRADVDSYENDSGEIDENADIKDVENFFKNDMISKLDSCIEYLKKASEIGEKFSIDQKYTGSEDLTWVDKGDILLCQAIAHGLKGYIQFSTSYNWQHNAKDAETLDDMDQISMETLFKGTNLLALQSSSQLNDARTSFIAAVDNYLEAIAIIDTRIGVDSLFKLDPDDVADKNETTADLEEFKSAIQSDSYTMEDDDFEGDKKIINPNAFFAGKVDPMKQLPQSEAKFLSVIGDKFTTDLVEDPTFGGFLPHWDQTYFKQKLLDWEMLDTNASPTSTTKEVSSQSKWSYSGWLGYLHIPKEQSENAFYAYHQYFGWIYMIPQNSSSVWIVNINDNKEKNEWLWTKPTIFPFIYNHTLKTWYYLADGTNGKFLYTWNSTSEQWEK